MFSMDGINFHATIEKEECAAGVKTNTWKVKKRNLFALCTKIVEMNNLPSIFFLRTSEQL
jgi:hypothetical protein